jgi:hypothetical protein
VERAHILKACQHDFIDLPSDSFSLISQNFMEYLLIIVKISVHKKERGKTQELKEITLWCSIHGRQSPHLYLPFTYSTDTKN